VPNFNLNDWQQHFGANPVVQGFKYNSGENDQWLSVEAIRELIKIHMDSEFTPV
jgi:hypothetical protein